MDGEIPGGVGQCRGKLKRLSGNTGPFDCESVWLRFSG